MRVRVSAAVKEPKEVERLVRAAFRAVGDGVNGKDTEVHIRAGWQAGAARGLKLQQRGFSGLAYIDIPSMARVARGTKHLVTLRVAAEPRKLRGLYPRTTTYPGMKTAPEVRVECWHEDLYHVAAHEAFHVRQYRRGWSLSEVDADREALRLLRMSRTGEPLCSCAWRPIRDFVTVTG